MARSKAKRISQWEAVELNTIANGGGQTPGRPGYLYPERVGKLVKRGLVQMVSERPVLTPDGRAAFRAWEGT